MLFWLCMESIWRMLMRSSSLTWRSTSMLSESTLTLVWSPPGPAFEPMGSRIPGAAPASGAGVTWELAAMGGLLLWVAALAPAPPVLWARDPVVPARHVRAARDTASEDGRTVLEPTLN